MVIGLSAGGVIGAGGVTGAGAVVVWPPCS